MTKVVAGAGTAIALGSGVHVFDTDGAPGAISNSGAESGGGLTLGANVQVGDLTSVPAISMGANSTAGIVRTGGTVTRGANTHVTGVLEHATLTPAVVRTVTVHPPSGPHTSLTVPAHATAALAPAEYANVTVGANGVLDLSTGTYFLDNLTVGSNAEVRLSTKAGNVNLYVRGSMTWNGKVVGDGSHFVLGVLGNGAATLQGSFSGTALVPSGTLTLGANGAYQGAFYAKTMNVGANATLRKLATPFLIDGISASKTTVCVGEQTEVTVVGATTAPGATVSINGSAGPHQFVQFSGAPGPRRVSATLATADGHVDFVDFPLTLTKCELSPGATPPVALHYAGSRLGGTDRVEFSVSSYDTNGHEVTPSSPATYVWSFGDGTTQTTSGPIVDHDYASAVDPLAQFNYFNAAVTVTTGTGSPGKA